MGFRSIKALLALALVSVILINTREMECEERIRPVMVTITQIPDAEGFWAHKYGIDRELARLIIGAADTAEIDYGVAFALVDVESNFNPKAVSHKGAIGLAQVMLPTARMYGPITKEELFEPRVNLDIGFTYLSGLNKKYQNMPIALAAYNSGPTRVDRMLAMGMRAPRVYAEKVLGR